MSSANYDDTFDNCFIPSTDMASLEPGVSGIGFCSNGKVTYYGYSQANCQGSPTVIPYESVCIPVGDGSPSYYQASCYLSSGSSSSSLSSGAIAGIVIAVIVFVGGLVFVGYKVLWVSKPALANELIDVHLQTDRVSGVVSLITA